ncbi:hypothetical protein EDC94DRAFT_607908 [Helicostylum pulchrum]|nr:hypothetical protein EDC94DRAFT_607908 [Helicostylum pulchrum]
MPNCFAGSVTQLASFKINDENRYHSCILYVIYFIILTYTCLFYTCFMQEIHKKKANWMFSLITVQLMCKITPGSWMPAVVYWLNYLFPSVVICFA